MINEKEEGEIEDMKEGKEKLLRCFIAVEMPREVIDEVEEIQKLVKNKNFFYGKFTEPENLHLTLKFLGEISEEKMQGVWDKLLTIRFSSFEVSLGNLGFFSKRAMRILWAKLLGKQLWELQKAIDEKLTGLEFAKEERFMSHITIARIKKVINREKFIYYVKNLKHRPIKFEVKEFILKKSELTPDGPVYTDLKKFHLD